MKKPYIMHITEKRTRQVIAWAENRDEACALTEKLCNENEIDMAEGDFGRDVFVQFKAQNYDLETFEQFGEGERHEDT